MILILQSGKKREGSGEWGVGSGQWAVGSGQWAVGSGQLAVGKFLGGGCCFVGVQESPQTTGVGDLL